MAYIYSTTALTTKQREVKDAARENIVHITENGNGAFIFCSEEVFEAELEKAREEASYEARCAAVLKRSHDDFSSERFCEGLDALKEAVAAERAAS